MENYDQILTEIYKHKAIGTKDLANRIGISEPALINAVNQIMEMKPYFVFKVDGFGENQYTIHPARSATGDLQAFFDQGGFTAINQTRLEEKERTIKQQLKEEYLSELQIAELLRLPKESRRTRLLSWIAIGIAIATLLFEIYKRFWT